MMRYKNSRISSVSWIVVPVIAIGLILWLFTAISNLQAGRNSEGKEQLENAIRKSAISCYAAEGSYPPTLEYIIENYGIQIDESRYKVFYHAQAQNLMPEITVVELEE